MSKQIKINLSNNSVDGIWKVKLMGWDVLAYKIPRGLFSTCKKQDDFLKAFYDDINKHGIYFLLGWDMETQKQCVYVGKAQEQPLNKRIFAPHNFDNKEWEWTEAIIYVGIDEPIENLSSLERQFFLEIKHAERYKLINIHTPPAGHLPLDAKELLSTFIENAKLVMAALGHSMFQCLPQTNKNELKDERIWKYTRTDRDTKKTYVAYGIFSNGKFVLLKGSEVRERLTPRCPDYIEKMRNEYENLIKDHVLRENISFNSPSAAASFIAGTSVNGLLHWKNNEISIRDSEKLDN